MNTNFIVVFTDLFRNYFSFGLIFLSVPAECVQSAL